MEGGEFQLFGELSDVGQSLIVQYLPETELSHFQLALPHFWAVVHLLELLLGPSAGDESFDEDGVYLVVILPAFLGVGVGLEVVGEIELVFFVLAYLFQF
jgi:hypothetical protein